MKHLGHLLIGDLSEICDGFVHLLQHLLFELRLVLQNLFFDAVQVFLVFLFLQL